jgi:hypothetical protein
MPTATHVQVAGAGLELFDGSDCGDRDLRQLVKSSGAKSGAVEFQNHRDETLINRTDASPTDPALARVVAIWQKLPEEIRSKILALAHLENT